MCFGWYWFLHALIAIVVICGIIALLRELVRFLAPKLGIPGDWITFLVNIVTIVLYTAIGVAAVVLVGELIACMWGWVGGFSFFPAR